MRRLATVLTALGSAAALSVAAATPAAAHGTDRAESADKRRQFSAGVTVPVVSTPNVHFVTNVPDTAGISGVFARTAPYFYLSSTDSISVYDVSDPLRPRLTGILPNVVFENEAMNYGEKTQGGRLVRFVLVGVDAVQASPGDISHTGRSNEMVLVDVTDPAKPYIRSRLKTTTNTHTISCINEASCRYAYTAGRNGTFSILDLANVDAPVEVDADPASAGTQPFASPAGGPNAAFSTGAGHKWNFDKAGYGVHTGSGGSAVFDVRNPRAPRLVTTTDANGVRSPWNDFIHHNSARPNAGAYAAGRPASVRNGNVLLVTEEDYENPDCKTAGSFQTWEIGSLSGAPAALHPLDRINPVDPGEGVATPAMAFCSAHWFDYHPSGIVAAGFYEGGLRLIDVRNARDLKEYGYVASGLSEVWDAYWVPARNRNGVASGKTNIVYTVDLVRGLDVYTVDLPGSRPATPPLLGGVGGSGTTPLALTVLAALLGAAVLVRRRTAAAPVPVR